MKVTILGSGSAAGVPMISAGWGRCDPGEPKNRRMRASLLVETQKTTILVDTGPDLREQLLNAKVQRLDGILYTHAHADHTHGIDEIREINRLMRAAIPTWGMDSTLMSLKNRFDYAFNPFENISSPDVIIYHPWLTPQVIDCHNPQSFSIGEIQVVPFLQDHGWETSLGFRFGDVAYSTDVTALDERAFAILEGVKVWIVGCLTERPHTTHADVKTVLNWVMRIKPQRTILTHMGIGLDYATLKSALPHGVEPGYDGLVIDIK
ncbi:MAG: MBL fold metallo-hydrolase [Rhodospirillaceae bacterium]|nr:MBL fold metallo-hydrolase [Rhodospirillaceae bacterium]